MYMYMYMYTYCVHVHVALSSPSANMMKNGVKQDGDPVVCSVVFFKGRTFSFGCLNIVLIQLYNKVYAT